MKNPPNPKGKPQPALELCVRHGDADRFVGACGTIALLRDNGAAVRPAPIVRSIEHSVGTQGDCGGMPRVIVEWDGLTSHLEVIARLGRPIPGKEHISRVYVLCLGLSRKTKVCDAATGEEILVTGVRVRLVAGEPAFAWVDPWVDPALSKAAS